MTHSSYLFQIQGLVRQNIKVYQMEMFLLSVATLVMTSKFMQDIPISIYTFQTFCSVVVCGLRLAFNVSGNDQGSHPDDLSVSVLLWRSDDMMCHRFFANICA